MNKNLAQQCIEGLTLYAVERQVGFQNHQHSSGILTTNPENRNTQVRKMIKSLAEFWRLSENIEADFLMPFDKSLETAQHCFASGTASFEHQRAVIRGLSCYADRLPEAATDARPELLRIRSQLEDIFVYLPWDAEKLRINPAIDQIDRDLASLTAHRNILFTRLLLGSERGPAMSGFVSGAVTDETGVLNSRLYDDLQEQYPEIAEWPAISTIYFCGNGTGTHKNASELDLQIMRETGDVFLDLEGIDCCGSPLNSKFMQLNWILSCIPKQMSIRYSRKSKLPLWACDGQALYESIEAGGILPSELNNAAQYIQDGGDPEETAHQASLGVFES